MRINDEWVKIYTESDGVYEVSFTKDIKEPGSGISRRMTIIGYYFWKVLLIYVLGCSLVYFLTLSKQGSSPYVNVPFSIALMDLGFVFFPITDYWNVILKSTYLFLFVVAIILLSAWRFLKARSDMQSMIAIDDLLTCYKEYDAGNYKHAIKCLNKIRDKNGFLKQELIGNLAYLYYRQGDRKKAESVLLSIYDTGTVINAKNIRVIAE